MTKRSSKKRTSKPGWEVRGVFWDDYQAGYRTPGPIKSGLTEDAAKTLAASYRKSGEYRSVTAQPPGAAPTKPRGRVVRNDRRELMGMIKAFPEGAEIDENKMTVSFELDQDEGEPLDCVLPFKFEVCGTCGGKGSHVNPSIDSHGITASEWEEDYDEESRETYMSGGYDVPCNECGGQRVVPEIDEARADKKCLDAYRAWQKNEYESAAERAYQQRMGY
jgi:hypothetical protein